jgi:hypothetical protein
MLVVGAGRDAKHVVDHVGHAPSSGAQASEPATAAAR